MSTEASVASTTIRAAPVEPEPSRRVGDVLDLLDDLSVVIGLSDRLMRGIERLTGLRPGEIRVILTLSTGAQPLSEVERRIGEPDHGTVAIVDDLVDRGLLSHGVDASSIGLTESGAATLEQIQAVQIRLLDAVADAAGESGVQALRTTLQALADVGGIVDDRAALLPV